MASAVCVLVKICVSSISLYKLDPDKLTTVEPLNNGHIGGRDFVPCREVVHYWRLNNTTAICLVPSYVSIVGRLSLARRVLYRRFHCTPFESAHRFTLVCTVSDSKTIPGCHYNSCSNHSFVLTDKLLPLFVQSGFLTPWTLSALAIH